MVIKALRSFCLFSHLLIVSEYARFVFIFFFINVLHHKNIPFISFNVVNGFHQLNKFARTQQLLIHRVWWEKRYNNEGNSIKFCCYGASCCNFHLFYRFMLCLLSPISCHQGFPPPFILLTMRIKISCEHRENHKYASGFVSFQVFTFEMLVDEFSTMVDAHSVA